MAHLKNYDELTCRSTFRPLAHPLPFYCGICVCCLLRADVAVDEDNGRVYGVGRVYNPDLDLTGSLHVRAFKESDGHTLWSFQEHGWNPSLVFACRLCGAVASLLLVFWRRLSSSGRRRTWTSVFYCEYLVPGLISRFHYIIM